MALPTNLAAKIKSIPMDPTVLASNLELAYLLSFASHTVSHDSVYLYPRQSYQSPLEHYQFADFQDETYAQLLEETTKNYRNKNRQVVKGIRCGFKEFYARVAAVSFNMAIKFMSREKQQNQKKLTLAKEEEDDYRVQKLKGSNPTKWPETTKDFVKDISTLPWHAFSSDAEIMFKDFIESVKTAIINLCHKAKVVDGKLQEQFKDHFELQIQAFISVILRTTSQSFILEHLKFISELRKHINLNESEENQLCKKITTIFDKFFNIIPQEPAQKYHSPGSLWNRQPFVIMKKIHFQKYAGLAYYSITTDGKFLYFYVSAVNGGMFKIGTGQKGTKAGKIYLEKQIHFPIGTKVEQVTWVYLKGKLYLKASLKDPWMLEVINPDTLEKEGNVQIFCPSLFGQQSLINLNKNCPIMTDGERLYYLANRIKICKTEDLDHKEDKKKSPEKLIDQKKPKEDPKKNVNKRKPGKKPQQGENPPQQPVNQNYQKILEVVLYEFSVDGDRVYSDQGIDQKDIEQLYDSFSGYFTREECKRALVLNNYDLAQTCQWLFNQGEKEKEKNIKVFDQVDYTILAQCQITSNFQEKAIKGPSEIVTKDGSILAINNVYESLWTMDKEHISCYSEHGLKIFSKNKKDFKKHPDTKLKTTLLKVLEPKFPRNPECNVVYDPYNYLFYTFAWPPDGHYFPTAVMVSNDKKHLVKVEQQKRFDSKIKCLDSLSNLQKFALQHMNFLDRGSVKAKYHFNDWLWYYGQRIIQISNQMNLADSDKKRLSNKRTKVLAKINKINQAENRFQKDKAELATNGRVIKEIVKIYPFEAEGTIKSYQMINEAFKNLPEHPQEIYLYVLSLQNWLSNCSVASVPETKNVLIELGQNLLLLREKAIEKNKDLINKLLIQQFYLFFPTLEKQIRYITSLNGDELRAFVQAQWRHEKKQNQSIVYQLTKKEQLIQKYEINKCDFSQVFKVRQNMNTNDIEKVQLLGNLLLSSILKMEKGKLIHKGKYDQTARKNFFVYVQRQLVDSPAGNQLIEFLFLAGLKMLVANNKDCQLFNKYLSQLFVEVFRLYEKTLSKVRTTQLYTFLPTLLMIIEVYHGSLIPLHPNQEIISSLMKITQFMQRPQLNEVYNILDDYEYEGISPTTQKIYETSHPLQRGKNLNFPPKKFHNASLLLIDLDKRCQSDPNNDTLTIQIVHEDSPVGNNIQVNDGVFNSNVRLSGVIDTKKPYLMFGKAFTVDFNSSGHVKDTQSLVRYGFKFGLRPVFAGKITFNYSKKEKLTKLFESIENFEYYFNTLKVASIALSTTIQNFLHLENQSADSRLNQLLQSKIFNQGYEQIACKPDSRQFDAIETITAFMNKTQHESVDKTILKNSQDSYWIRKEQTEKNKTLPPTEELWSFEGIPLYIRTYLQQIKEFKGNFIDVFIEARELAKEKGTYAQIMKRKTVNEHKTLWLQGEAILFLTILKHSGLLHLNLKFSIEYIKENLKAFQDARDGIYNAFISRIQYVNEWRQLVQTYLGKNQDFQMDQKQPVKEEKKPQVKSLAIKKKGVPSKTVKIGQKVPDKSSKQQKIQEKPAQKHMNKAKFEKEVRERLSQEVLIKGVCKTKDIKYEENNHYETVSRIIQQVILASQTPLEPEEQVYKDPIQHLIKCCLFLLKFKSPSTKESLSDNEHIVPVGMMRSLSEGNSRNLDTNKVNLFRQWLQNWKNWKGFKKEGHVQLQFPVQEIVRYINSWHDLRDIQNAINRRFLKCQNRIQFYLNYNQLLKLLSQNTKIVKYVLGSQMLNIYRSATSDLEAISAGKIKELQDIYNEFKSSIKNVQGMLISNLPMTLDSLEQALKGGSSRFLERIKLLLHTLFLLESQNPEINLNVLLYVMPLRYLSHQNEDLIYIVNALLHRGFVARHSNQEIVFCLQREIGNSSISYKRWKDYFFVQRVLFLLRKLEVNLRSKVKVQQPMQVKIAQGIFYMLYHLDIPLVAKLGHKLLKRLSIPLKSGIKTAFDYEYKLYRANTKRQLQLIQQFKLPSNDRNNVTLLCSKINSVLDPAYSKQLSSKFQQAQHKQNQGQNKYNIILNLHQEEDLYWMLKVLYYLDELEVKKGQKTIPQIKDFNEYLQLKNKKKEADKKDQNSNQNEKEKNPYKEQEKNERLFNNLPKISKIDPEFEKQLPVGWFFNYCDIFGEAPQKLSSLMPRPVRQPSNPVPNNLNANNNNQNGKSAKKQNPNANNQAAGKKNWTTTIFTKLAKKYQQYTTKPPEEPKEGDSAEVKAEFVKARNVYNRVRRYFIEISSMIDYFSKTGFYVFREGVSQSKMHQICQLISSGSMNRLRDVQLNITNNDFKTRLSFNQTVPNFSSKLKITLIKDKDYGYFHSLVGYQNSLLTKADHHQSSYYSLLGKRELSLEDSKAFMPYEVFIPFDEEAQEGELDIQFGKQWIQSNFSRMKKKGEKVYLSDYPSDKFFIAEGGIESGLKDGVLLPANDPHLTMQTSPLEKILTEPKLKSEEAEYEETELPEELVEKIEKIMDKGRINIESKQDVRDYLLLTFYLKKLRTFNLEFGDMSVYRNFAKKLFTYTENLHSYKQLSVYEQQSQRLIMKLVDNEHEKLHLFGNYIPDGDYDRQISQYLIPTNIQKLNSTNEVKQQSVQTHAYIKSKYLLNSQPPQIEQNKLLKYWEKNILPRILEFVKTTLKPLQIEDFWEQMRRPLRVGDHTQAKRVAYIICDNKLPAGAVLPDASHNWNALQVEEIFVGENVLVKIPKNRSDFTTPLLSWGGHDHRLGKIVFVDSKSNSVLVRYRVEELGLFSYTWVPINTLSAVEKEVMHISTKSIYEQLESKLEGMVYIYAKECLTKLAGSVAEVDNTKLIKETILDMFVKNPISGCFSFPKPTWSMRSIFQKMLQEGNYSILDLLQKEFCRIRGLDLNLNNENMTQLNRFENCKALIVSFKRDAKLSQCSGVRFYNDKYGYNEIAHVYTAKSQRTDLQPLEFNEPNIYCKYYTNKEALSILEQSNYKIHPIEATVFAVDDYWTIGCYIGDILCDIAEEKKEMKYVQILKRINKIFIQWLSKKSVSILCSYLARLISKIGLTIGGICEHNQKEVTLELLGVNNQQLKNIVTWINRLQEEESKEKVALYSALLQNLSEMVASLLVKVNNAAVMGHLPEHVKATIDLIKIFKEVDTLAKTKKVSLLQPSPPPTYQWQRILQITNIPAYFSPETIYNKMKEIILTNKGKILCPKLDIFIGEGRCFILVDGWDINELVEEEVMQKMQQELPEEREDQMDGSSAMEWTCIACTFQNPSDTNLCQVCQTPAPVVAKQEEVYDEVEATDLKEAQRKVREKQSKRFEDVKVQILQFFEQEYKVICDLVNKKNNEADNKKNKKGGKEEVIDLKEAPKKPQIKIETGRGVFDRAGIDSFLEARYKCFPSELQKLVASEQTFLAKFKKLLQLGYDLWGDNTYSESATLIPFSYLYQLMDYIQTEICKGSSSVLSYSEDSIRILSQISLLDQFQNDPPLNYTSENDVGVRVKYKTLAGFKSYNIRYSWKFVKELNLATSKCLQLINMDFKFDKSRNNTYPISNDCLGYKIKYYRNLIMGVIKLELFQKIMQKTSIGRENDQVPKISLERLKVREQRVKFGLVTVREKEEHLFTKSHDQFLKVSPALLRPFKPKGTDPYLSFTVNFKGENVMGEAGPYRQFFTDIGRELDPQYGLGLFIRSPNNRSDSGQFKSKWIINPKANSTYHFSLFEFVGTLMGCCFRTGSHIALDLPLMFWKSIVHEEITDSDLEEVDTQLISFMKMLSQCPSKEQFQEAMEYTNGGQLAWVYRSSDGDTHQLVFNGKNIKVQFEEIPKYLQMLKLARINESKLQVKRIVKGISQLIPLPYLHCLTGEELKLIICGRPRVDVQLLKKHTKYSGGLTEDSRRIKFFWDIMRELTQIDKLKIIRFCWGQERLPINSQQFQRNNIRFMIKPMVASNRTQDLALPKADTCFFNIELPDYSSLMIMRQKLLLAVNLDNVSINADDNIYNDDNPLMNEVNNYDEGDYGEENEEEW